MRNNALNKYRPSFISGLMSLFSFGINSRRFEEYLRGDDSDDIAEDWRSVGDDLRSAITQYNREYILQK